MRVTGLTTRRDLVMLTRADFDEPPRALGKIELPTDYAPNRHDFQKEVVHRLEPATLAPHSRTGRRDAVEVRRRHWPIRSRTIPSSTSG